MHIKPNSQIQDYLLVKQLGQGSYAKVWLAIHQPTKTKVALKIIDLNEEGTKEKLQKEINIFDSLDHPFIAQFFEDFEIDHFHFISQELVEEGTVRDFINGLTVCPDKLINKIFVQLVSAMEYLHTTKHIAHRDLKCENIMLDNGLNVRLIDFGFSTDCSHLMSTFCGSSAYLAPELLHGNKYDTRSDIWAAGVVLYSMFSCQLPFYDDNMKKMFSKILYEQPFYPASIPEDAVDLITKMLNKDPEYRISLEGIKAHPWFLKYDYNVDKYVDRYLSNDFDHRLLDQMWKYDFEVNAVYVSLVNKVTTKGTIAYRILKRTKETKNLSDKLISNTISQNNSEPNGRKVWVRVPQGKQSNSGKQMAVKMGGIVVRRHLFKPANANSAKRIPLPNLYQ